MTAEAFEITVMRSLPTILSRQQANWNAGYIDLATALSQGIMVGMLSTGGDAAGEVPRHRPAGGLLAVDRRDPPEVRQPHLVGRRAARRVGPEPGRQVVAGHQILQHRAVVAGGIFERRAPDDSPCPVDGHMVLVPEQRDRDRRQLPAGAFGRPLPAELHRTARIKVLQGGLRQLPRPDRVRRFGRLDSLLLRVGQASFPAPRAATVRTAPSP